MEINKIYNENCLDTMAKMPDNFIDLTVTSPPYDDLRTYNGYCFDFENVAKELFRVTKQGGVVVWVVGDQTKNGSETGTSFRQALYFINIGFKLHDTMIYKKQDSVPLSHKRYEQCFEYMFIFVKDKIKTFNGLKDKKNVHAGELFKGTFRDLNGKMKYSSGHKNKIISDYGLRVNIWEYRTTKIIQKTHPATFPEQLANDHIISWSNEGDLIYDPFMGSGTTAKMAILNNRKYIGSEISEEYCKIIETRIKECGGLFFNSFET